MTDKLDIRGPEDEDVARARQWWGENGKSIIAGVVLGTVVVVGYNYWKAQEESRASASAEAYQQVVDSNYSAESLAALSGADSKSVYNAFAALAQAKKQVEDKDIDAAIASLESVVAMDGQPELGAVASQRLASLYLEKNEPQKVLDFLSASKLLNSESLKGRTLELTGDAYFMLADKVKAKQAYSDSKDAYGQSPDATMVTVKLNNL